MSEAAPVAVTEMQQALNELSEIKATQQKFADAINGLGANVQWLVDNVQSIFQMFSSPQFGAMLPSILGGAVNGMEAPDHEALARALGGHE